LISDLLVQQWSGFGPSDRIKFFGIKINTWPRWISLAIYSFIDTIILQWAKNIMKPWITNTIQDHKSSELPYPREICVLICIIYYIISNGIELMEYLILFSSLDFVIIKLFAAILIYCPLIADYISKKKYNPKKNETMLEEIL
jgi:hypothetical protein